MIKLPKGIKKPSHSKLSAPSITSHTTGSVVLTKLDGGGSYHSTSKEDQSQTDISNQERFSGSTSRKIELSAHPLTPRRILFFKDISLRFNFFTSLLRRANSATIVPSFDDPRTMVGDETLQPTQFSKETVDNPQNSDGLKKSPRKYQQIRFTETLPRLHEKDSDLKRSAQEKQMPPFKEVEAFLFLPNVTNRSYEESSRTLIFIS